MKSPEEMGREVFSRREEYKENKIKRVQRFEKICTRVSTAFMVVLLVGTIGLVSVLAATVDIGELFRSIFSYRQNGSLSDNQAAYIEEHAAAIGESVSNDGFTITIKGALTDGTTAHILVDVVAPPDVDIESEGLGFYMDFERLRFPDQGHLSSVGSTYFQLEDNDGKSNTASILIQYNVYTFRDSDFTLADGRMRRLKLSKPWYVEDTYPYTFVTLAEGPWEFEFVFGVVSDKEVELLDAPIAGSYTQISGKEVYATINSLQVKGLSATLYYSIAPDVAQEGGDFGCLKFVMKDGSTINAYPKKAGKDAVNGNFSGYYCTYIYEAPVTYDDIETVYIGDTAIAVGSD